MQNSDLDSLEVSRRADDPHPLKYSFVFDRKHMHHNADPHVDAKVAMQGQRRRVGLRQALLFQNLSRQIQIHPYVD